MYSSEVQWWLNKIIINYIKHTMQCTLEKCQKMSPNHFRILKLFIFLLFHVSKWLGKCFFFFLIFVSYNWVVTWKYPHYLHAYCVGYNFFDGLFYYFSGFYSCLSDVATRKAHDFARSISGISNRSLPQT